MFETKDTMFVKSLQSLKSWEVLYRPNGSWFVYILNTDDNDYQKGLIQNPLEKELLQKNHQLIFCHKVF